MSATGLVDRPPLRLGSRLTTIVVLAITLALVAVGTVIIDRVSGGGGTSSVELTGDVAGAAPAVGQTPPDFKATLVDGTPVSLSQFSGQPVWLTFGASWCGDCRAEAPDLEATYQKFQPQGLVVLAVNIEEDAQAVKDYAARAGLTYPAVADPSTTIASRYRILGIPTHYFIGRDGKIAAIRVGGLQPQDMEQLVSGILAN
jgi:cytochrome c biogenesis protein CcmG/thiol:disulfide interchange protein DsbE